MTTPQEFFDDYFGWEDAVIPERPDFAKYTDVVNLMDAYSKHKNQELVNFLLNIEAWLTFNQTPNAENTRSLRVDIKKLLDIE